MRSAARRKWKSNDEPSPSEIRAMRERGEWIEEEDDDDEPSKKAPFFFRFLAWASLIVLFFGVGYGVTSVVFKWMDGRGGTRTPANLVVDRQDTQNLARAASADASGQAEQFVFCTLSIPEGNSFVSRQIRCNAGLRDDVIRQTLSAYMDAVKESRMLELGTQNLNIFQSGEWLYLNMNKNFLDSLNSLGSEKSRYLLTGLVKTMADNFAPISKVKFYIDGKEVRDKKPVDLSMPWGITG